MDNLPQELKAGLTAVRVLLYTEVASLTLVYTDYLDTVLLEAKYMWPIRWNTVNVLFLILRYVPILHITSILPATLITTIPWAWCPAFFIINATLIHVMTACAEAVMFIRVHAIGGRSKKLGTYLVAHYCLSMVGIFTMLGIYYKTIDYAEKPYSRSLGCSSLRGQGRLLTILYGIILFNEAVAMILTMVIGYRKYLSSRNTPLWQIFYRQGTLYFLSLTVTSLGNMLVNHGATREFSYTFVILQYALHNIFTNRMMFHIRQSVAEIGGYDRSLTAPEQEPVSIIAFAPRQEPNGGFAMDEPQNWRSRRTANRF